MCATKADGSRFMPRRMCSGTSSLTFSATWTWETLSGPEGRCLPPKPARFRSGLPRSSSWPKGFGQDDERGKPDRNLAGFGGKQRPSGPDKVSQVQVAENVKLLVPEHILLGINLEPSALVAHIDEHALTHVPVGRYSPGDGYLAPFDIVSTRLRAFCGGHEFVLKGVNAPGP